MAGLEKQVGLQGILRILKSHTKEIILFPEDGEEMPKAIDCHGGSGPWR